MNNGRSLFLAAGILFLAATATKAAKPEASFALVDGWIEARVEQDGKPVAGAVIEVFDVIGAPFAKGETGGTGVGTFPRPRGHTCRLGVTVAGKSCDSVLLQFDGDSVVQPARVQLTFGDRSCCRSPGRAWSASGETDEGPDSRAPALLYFAAGGCCVAAALTLLLFLRRPA